MNNEPENLDLMTDAGDSTVPPAQDVELEGALRRALRLEQPSPGFADRVLASAGITAAPPVPVPVPAAGDARGRLLHWPAGRLWIGGSIAAALLLGCFEGEVAWRRFREQQLRVAAATAQFEVTERITVRALAQAKEQLQRAGVPLTLD